MQEKMNSENEFLIEMNKKVKTRQLERRIKKQKVKAG